MREAGSVTVGPGGSWKVAHHGSLMSICKVNELMHEDIACAPDP